MIGIGLVRRTAMGEKMARRLRTAEGDEGSAPP